jgi:hypothetical protein
VATFHRNRWQPFTEIGGNLSPKYADEEQKKRLLIAYGLSFDSFYMPRYKSDFSPLPKIEQKKKIDNNYMDEMGCS